ncbi:MAG TPA: hypothetical protein VKA44_08180, partial [Gemmatimonadota bacterium]|nr:hypothetical protein [Gemmatimonadota bacterium]
MIVGAQKAGTTSLFRYLAGHPGLAAHPQREMPYFLVDELYAAGYEAAFEKYFGVGGDSGRLPLAKHVMAMYSQKAVDRLRGHNPEVRVVAVLRNPAERARSAYLYARRRGWEPLPTFEAALRAEPQRLAAEGWEHWRQCAYARNGQYLEPV